MKLANGKTPRLLLHIIFALGLAKWLVPGFEDFALAAEALGLDASGGLPHWSLSFARSRNEFKKIKKRSGNPVVSGAIGLGGDGFQLGSS